jgi:DNA polymerase I-like protein with 3'-5' exonuclease and polymerase domains
MAEGQQVGRLRLWTASTAEVVERVLVPHLSRMAPRPKYLFATPEEEASPQPGEVLVGMGAVFMDRLKKRGLFPKGLSMTSLRERAAPLNGGWAMLSLDPEKVLVEPWTDGVIGWDLRLADRLSRTGYLRPETGDYSYASDLTAVINYVEWKHADTGRPVDVSVDLETMGLVPFAPDKSIVSFSASVEEGVADVVHVLETDWTPAAWQEFVAQVAWLLTTPKIKLVGANLKYDLLWIRLKWGLVCTNLSFDTLLVGSLLDENRSNSLKSHAKTMTSMGGYELDFNSKFDMNNMESVPAGDLLMYAGADTDACLRAKNVMQPELLKDRALTNLYVHLVRPASRAFEAMEARGVLVDVVKMKALETKLDGEIASLTKTALAQVPAALRAKYAEFDPNKLLGKPAFLKEFFFTKGGLGLKPRMRTEVSNEPSTSHDHLMMFDDHPAAKEFTAALKKLRSAEKTRSTYVVGFLKHLRSDGRFHPSYMLFKGEINPYADEDEGGSVTGRCLAGDVLVSTNKGELPIKDVVARGVAGEAFSVLTHRSRWRAVTGFVVNGIKPVYRVSTSAGEIVCTGNHPVMSFPSWKLTDDLACGDVCYSRVLPPECEEWRAIEGWPYEVSNFGAVRRSVAGGGGVAAHHVMAQRENGKGDHQKVALGRCANGYVQRSFYVHVLVCGAFHGERPPGSQVSHLNGLAGCNWSTNLKWASVAENRLFMRLHGTSNKEGQCKLTWADVDAIRLSVESTASLARKHGVNGELVRDVRAWKRWNGRREPMAGFMPATVMSVVSAGYEQTYDISVKDDRSFLANGLVVHNTSLLDPPMQTIPKITSWAKEIRDCYPAPVKKVILACDFSQGELKIAACLAPEPTMLSLYKNGGDLHSMTAARLAGMSLDGFAALKASGDKERMMLHTSLRTKGKAMNFGLLFGMAAEGFKNYALWNYGVVMTSAEAEQAVATFFETYPGLIDYQKAQKAFVRRHRMVRSPLGRVRHLPHIESTDGYLVGRAGRQAINAPIQSCLSDMCQLTLAELHRRYPELEVVLMVHDQIIMYVPEDEVDIWAHRVRAVMATLPLARFGWEPQLVFTADAEAGLTLATLHDV